MPKPPLSSKLLVSLLLSAAVLVLLSANCVSASARTSGDSAEAEEQHGAEETLTGMLDESEEALASAASTQTSPGGEELTLSASTSVQFGESADLQGLVLYQSGTRYLTIFLVPPQVGNCPADPVAPAGADLLLASEAVDDQTPVSDMSDPLDRSGEWQLCGYLSTSASQPGAQVTARSHQPVMVSPSGSSQDAAGTSAEAARNSTPRSRASTHARKHGEVCRRGKRHRKAGSCRKPAPRTLKEQRIPAAQAPLSTTPAADKGRWLRRGLIWLVLAPSKPVTAVRRTMLGKRQPLLLAVHRACSKDRQVTVWWRLVK